MKLYALIATCSFLPGLLAGLIWRDAPIWLALVSLTLAGVVHLALVTTASALYALYRPDPLTGGWE